MLEIARRHDSGDGIEVPPTTAELVIGGLLQIVNARVIRGQLDSLRVDLPEMLYCALVPFCGHAEASELAELTRRRGSGGSATATAAA
jgi:hypothetical protein